MKRIILQEYNPYGERRSSCGLCEKFIDKQEVYAILDRNGFAVLRFHQGCMNDFIKAFMFCSDRPFISPPIPQEN